MKILVTGGCGFIGSNIVDRLVAEGHDVAVIDDLSTGNIANLNEKATLYKMDIKSVEIRDVFEKVKPEILYHEAAQIDVQESIREPDFDAQINIIGSINVLKCCRDFGVRKLIYASSAAVYGDPVYLGVDEKHPVSPMSFYGVSKLTPERYIKIFSDLYGLKYTILRYANVYGIRQDPKGEGGAVSIFLDKLLRGEAPTIFGDGEQTRDFIFVKDIVSANLMALGSGDFETINVSTNTPSTVNKLYEYMKSFTKSEIRPIYGEERKGDIRHSYLNNEKAIKILGWQPAYSLEEGLSETVKYYMEKDKK